MIHSPRQLLLSTEEEEQEQFVSEWGSAGAPPPPLPLREWASALLNGRTARRQLKQPTADPPPPTAGRAAASSSPQWTRGLRCTGRRRCSLLNGPKRGFLNHGPCSHRILGCPRRGRFLVKKLETDSSIHAIRPFKQPAGAEQRAPWPLALGHSPRATGTHTDRLRHCHHWSK